MAARHSTTMFKFVGAAWLIGLSLLAVGSSAQAQSLKIGGTGAALGSLRLVADAFETANPGVTVIVAKSIGSGGGIKAVLAGALHIGLSARPLKPREREAGAKALKFARTPFVLVTSRMEHETKMTTSDLVYIYGGVQITWPDGTPIRLVLRPQSDSDWEMLARISPEFEQSLIEAASRRGLPVGFTDQEAMGMVERLPGGMGTASLSAVIAEQRRLRPITIDGVVPTLENIANGSYPLEKSLYLVTGPTPGALARRFIEFMGSRQAARILTDAGNLVVALAGSD